MPLGGYIQTEKEWEQVLDSGGYIVGAVSNGGCGGGSGASTMEAAEWALKSHRHSQVVTLSFPREGEAGV